VRLTQNLAPVGLIAVARLGLAPLLAAGVGLILGLEPPLFAIFIVAAGLPVAVNVYLLSAEYRLDRDLASQAVGWTTLLSALTLSALLAALS
jgi:predicted permease